ncbi:MAG TPA: hypothetical protein VK539_14385 [Myxococcaceae bacterium]|nr:hypothetical protein [Myxococcaceae bacterium]
MSLRRVLLSLACLSLGLLSACVLRPRYQDMVQQQGAAPASAGQTVMIRVMDPSTGQPISGARVVAGTGRERLSATSDAQGRLSVPVSKSLLDENPLVEVVLPKGVSRYQFELSRADEAPAQAPAETPVQAPAQTPAQAPAQTPAEGAGSTGTEPSTDSVKPPGEADGQR